VERRWMTYHKQKERVTRFASRSTPDQDHLASSPRHSESLNASGTTQSVPTTSQPRQPPVIPPPRPQASTCTRPARSARATKCPDRLH
jgi:hypothetical protein